MIVKDSIASIEMIAANQVIYDGLLEDERRMHREQIERWKQLEDEGTSVDELLAQ